MVLWLMQNMGNIVVLTLLAAVICFAIRSLFSNKKNNRSGCFCGCSGCALQGECNKYSDYCEELKTVKSTKGS